MGRIIRKLGGVFVPIIFCTALIFTAHMSLDLTDDLQGNARVINYIGIVRGATQRLIKKELNHVPDDELIYFLDNILSGPVSYTHLDVYKRQPYCRVPVTMALPPFCIQPRDFSSSVVIPPLLFPGEGFS